jgi:magnesium-transporting ATPase (P-type)
MRRPPRRITDRVIDRAMWVRVGYIGAVMAIATLLAIDLRLPGGLIPADGSLDEARTMGFTVLVLSQLFNAVNARSSRLSAFHRGPANPALYLGIAVSLLLQVAVVHLPFLNAAFSTVPLGPGDWLACAAIASSVLWADELRKLLARRRRRGQG